MKLWIFKIFMIRSLLTLNWIGVPVSNNVSSFSDGKREQTYYKVTIKVDLRFKLVFRGRTLRQRK